MIKSDSMKITIDIPEKEIKDAIRRRQRMAALTKHFGMSNTFMTHAELIKLRRAKPLRRRSA